MKIDNIKIAKIYAITLIKEAQKNKILEKVFQDIDNLKRLLETNEHCRLLFNIKILKATKKIEVLKTLNKILNLTTTTQSFLELLCKKRREYLIIEIIDQFLNQYHHLHDTLQIVLTSAQELSLSSIKKIETEIKTSQKIKKIIVEQKVRQDLIGGCWVEFDNKILDLSISTELQKIKKQLSQ